MAITLDGTNGINSSGVIVAPDGSASAPAITNDGDTNTGIFFPAADNIGFATNGVIRGRWTTDGLCFGSDTAAANALDDYEEGTWTPTLGVNGFNNAATLSSASGRYTKVGRAVTVQCELNMSGFCRPTGYCQVDGLPFTASATFVGAFGGSNAGTGIQGGSAPVYGTNYMLWYPTNGAVDSTGWFATVTYFV